LVLSAVGIELALIVAAVLWSGLLDESWTQPFAKLRWDWGEAALGAALSVPLFGLFWAAGRWSWGPLRHLREITEEILRPMLRPCKWPDVLLFSALAGFCEELLFRGAMQASLIQWLGLGLGILAASLLFGLAHALTFTYVIAATVIGLFLGLVFYWTDSLLVVMVTHGLYDVWAMLHLLYGPGSAPPPPPAAEVTPPEPDSCTNSHAPCN
jgi:hypothetical protein